MMEPTYVHGEVEVKRTGREATKPAPGGKTHVLVEITPANKDDGTWKKWVPPQALFSIVVDELEPLSAPPVTK